VQVHCEGNMRIQGCGSTRNMSGGLRAEAVCKTDGPSVRDPGQEEKGVPGGSPGG